MSRMFHGHRRPNTESDGSQTSSDQEESMSDVTNPSPPRYEHEYTGSRKVCMVRVALGTAYRSVALIKGPVQKPDAGQPWRDLGIAMRTIGMNGSDPRVRAALDVDALICPLMLMLKHEVLPLANSGKRYNRTLSKDEARATYAVRKCWTTLSPYKNGIQGPMLATPKWLLYRLYQFSFRPNDVLDLSNLPTGSMSDAEELDFSLACELFKIPVGIIKGLDLSGNALESLPIEFLSTFPSLESLTISQNPIKSLPLYITRIPLRSMTWRGYRPPIPTGTPQIGEMPRLAHRPRLSRNRSLMDHCLMALDRASSLNSQLFEMDLLPRIKELVTKCYKCEICDGMCAMRSADWLSEKQVFQCQVPGASEATGWIGLEGRICRSCLVVLGCLVRNRS